MKDITIIGAGPAGLTAGIYAARAGHSVAIIENGIYGGQVANTNEIENYPGFEKISGAELAINIYNQAVSCGAEILFEDVVQAKLDEKIKTVKTNKSEYASKCVIIANGTKRRKLNCEGEDRLNGKGVSYCATCDGAFFRGKDVLVVGGGNTALEDALFLSNNCNKVYIAHRRDEFRGEKYLVDAVKSKANIEILYSHVVDKIQGEDKVENVTVKNVKDNKQSTISVNGVFVAVGTIPNNDIFKESLELDKAGYIITDENCKTNANGVYAAGDTRKKQVRQIVTAVADGAVSAVMASSYINSADAL